MKSMILEFRRNAYIQIIDNGGDHFTHKIQLEKKCQSHVIYSLYAASKPKNYEPIPIIYLFIILSSRFIFCLRHDVTSFFLTFTVIRAFFRFLPSFSRLGATHFWHTQAKRMCVSTISIRIIIAHCWLYFSFWNILLLMRWFVIYDQLYSFSLRRSIFRYKLF